MRNKHMKDLKKKVKQYLVERGWEGLHPEDIAKSISIESAELLEIFQWDNSRTERGMNPEKLEKLKKELADILIYCFDMAVILDLDLQQIVEAKLEKVKEKYPAHLFADKDLKDAKTTKLYHKIKQEYRKKGKN